MAAITTKMTHAIPDALFQRVQGEFREMPGRNSIARSTPQAGMRRTCS
jgi:hypothetical protein